MTNASLNVKDYNTTSDGWLEWKGNQYFINQRSLTMEEARHFCRQAHGDLVSINSYAENVFLWKQVSLTFIGPHKEREKTNTTGLLTFNYSTNANTECATAKKKKSLKRGIYYCQYHW